MNAPQEAVTSAALHALAISTGPGTAATRRRFRSIAFIAGRILASVPVLLGVSLLTFIALDVLPGNAAQQLLGPEATAAQVERLEVELRLDRPAAERYWTWLTAALAGDLGRSLASGQQVGGMLSERLPVTLELMAYAFFLALALAIPTALVSACVPNGVLDGATRILGIACLSLPNYVLALLLVLVFSVHLQVFPSIGFVPPTDGITHNIESLTLPALAIALPLFGFYARFLRNDLLEQFQSQAYILTATAKGIAPWRVLLFHAFRNSVFGLLTIVALNATTLISGAVIVEQIFALPGIGQLLLQAINSRDVIVAQALVLLLAAITVATSLSVDVLYAVLDPRIRYGRG